MNHDPTIETKSFSRIQRIQLRLIQYAGFLIVGIGRTLRWETKGEDSLQQAHDLGKPVIFAFWHNRILAGTWYYRGRGIVVMTSMNFDGEYIARIIGMYGYRAARGSSSRGGMRALIQMRDCMAAGHDAAFTVDGPRGPRYQAKPGPVILAKKTGCPIYCFHISSSRFLQLNSWDGFQIPAPFSHALLLRAPLVWVPEDADADTLRAKQVEVQQVLNRLRIEGEAHWLHARSDRKA